jgi:hypothetical protein
MSVESFKDKAIALPSSRGFFFRSVAMPVTVYVFSCAIKPVMCTVINREMSAKRRNVLIMSVLRIDDQLIAATTIRPVDRKWLFEL